MALLIESVAIADERDRGSGVVRVDILLRDGAIGSSLGVAPDRMEGMIDAEGGLAVPGLINVRLHPQGTVMRACSTARDLLPRHVSARRCPRWRAAARPRHLTRKRT